MKATRMIAKRLAVLSAVMVLVSCGQTGGGKKITVVSREEGSGTRGAFIELFKIEEKAEGRRKDLTTKEAVVAPSTDVTLTTIANDPNAIGYISLGSLNPTVKAVTIDSVVPTAENILNGSYKVARPFLIATKGEPSALAADFISFILSTDGQAVVARSYVAVAGSGQPYAATGATGKLIIVGSSSVTPVMEKLKEAYQKINPQVSIEIQMSDSTSGMIAVTEGTAEIGLASRALKESELAELRPTEIARDGIAVIVNNANPTGALSSGQVKAIFTGGTTDWGTL